MHGLHQICGMLPRKKFSVIGKIGRILVTQNLTRRNLFCQSWESSHSYGLKIYHQFTVRACKGTSVLPFKPQVKTVSEFVKDVKYLLGKFSVSLTVGVILL
jgi:hypothetical protein